MTRAVGCDVAVVGLGAMGAATLYQLARRGLDVVGIDQYASPHPFGSSHGDTRITRCAVGEGADYVPFALASHEIWRELEGLSGQTLLEACGCLIMAPAGGAALHHGKPDFVTRSAASATLFGIAHERLDGLEIMRRFPQIERAEAMTACYEPGGGFVYPERCISVQLALATRAGARILQAPVTSIEQRGARVLIAAGAQVIEADRVVVAAGPWTATLLGAPFDRLLTVSRQVLHWFPADESHFAPGRFPTVIWMHGEGNEDYFYAFPTAHGSGLKAATEQYAAATDPAHVDREVARAESTSFHRTHLAGRLAGIGPEPLRAAACLYTVTPDAGFIVDTHPAMERVTVISACSGHGFKHSAGIGAAVADHLAGTSESEVLKPFGLARFLT